MNNIIKIGAKAEAKATKRPEAGSAVSVGGVAITVCRDKHGKLKWKGDTLEVTYSFTAADDGA